MAALLGRRRTRGAPRDPGAARPHTRCRSRSPCPSRPGSRTTPRSSRPTPRPSPAPCRSRHADPRTRAFVEQWRNASYNCFSSGHKFCREVCPVTQVERNESWTPTAFHANVVAMERGELDIEDVAADYVNCTQCGACELRCPNTLFTGDFYRFRTRTVDVVKAVRALAVESGVHQPGWQSLERAHRPAHARAGARRDAGQPGAGARLGRGAGSPDRRRDGPVRRLRGGVLPHVGAAGGRPDAADGRLRVRPDGRAVVLRRTGRGDGLRRAGPAVRPAQPGQLAVDRHEARAGARPARLHQLHRGLPEVLRRGVRHRGRARHRGAGRSSCARAG